jgi:hypothetical protein
LHGVDEAGPDINSGGELGVRGYVAAFDVESGKELWRAFNTGSILPIRRDGRYGCPTKSSRTPTAT